MKILLCHTDLRLYWPARLKALREFLGGRSARLEVIEISGKGSPYAFAGSRTDSELTWWRCLFPEESMERISPSRAARAVHCALDTLHPDVVLAGAIAFPSGAAAVSWARSRRRGVVIMDNARRSDVPRAGLTNWIKRRIYSNVDAMLLPAPSHVPDYEFWGIPRQKIYFGVNVVDNGFFAPHATRARGKAGELRARSGLPDRFLLGLGRQVAKKNWSSLVAAWGKFKRSRPGSDLKLVLVGEGPEHERLVAQAAALPRGDILFRGFVTQQGAVELYGLAAGLVLPSLHGETWGLVVNEAMAAGLPVLVSRQCGCAQTLVEHGHNGLIFDAENAESICEALVEFDKLGDRTSLWGERSRAIVEQWGLDRFCEGAWGAICHAHSSPKRPPAPLDRLLLKLWKGRYRPT